MLFRFKTRDEYVETLKKAYSEAKISTDTEELDELLDEFMTFCEVSGSVC